MMEECYLYKMHEQPRLDTDFDAKQWERFIDIAQCNIKMSKQCLAPLVETAEYWGMDKVHHYEWASMGRKYCKVLGSAASQNPVWEEALVKLNQLLLRRIAEGRPLKSSVNPICLLDLEHLIAWPDKSDFERKGRKTCTLKYEPIMESELPSGYALDQYGLIVDDHTQLASVAFTTTVSESLDHMYDSESECKAITTVPPKRRLRIGYNWRLDLAMLLWCVLLAALSWWYRRALKSEFIAVYSLFLRAARGSWHNRLAGMPVVNSHSG
jgi:hypothetical protein